MKHKSKVVTHNVEPETLHAFLRLTGRAFETGDQKFFTTAQSLLPFSFNVSAFCDKLVREQIAVRDRRYKLSAGV
jgi:hypothetical protein